MKIQRLNQNNGLYLGEKINIEEVLSSCIRRAKQHGWEIEKIFVRPNLELVVLKRIVSLIMRNIYISSGMHGDEPAGPVAIEKLLEKNEWPKDFNIYILPCLNPTGCKLHTRENEAGIDLNRDYLNPTSDEVIAHTAWLEKQLNFYMSLCLHEDWEADGFYVYGSNKIIAGKIADAVGEVFPIISGPADDRPTKNGVVDVSYNVKLPFWPEAFYLREKKESMNFTLETSSDYKLEERVNAHVVGVGEALKRALIVE